MEQQGIELESIRSQYVQEEAQRQVLENEQKDAQHALGEYKSECEALMGDYQTCAERLRETEEERDRHKKQVEIGLRELTKRADKIKQLEQQRTELTERGQHMDFQVCLKSKESLTKLSTSIFVNKLPITVRKGYNQSLRCFIASQTFLQRG